MSKKYPLNLYGTFGKHKIVFHVTWNTLVVISLLKARIKEEDKKFTKV